MTDRPAHGHAGEAAKPAQQPPQEPPFIRNAAPHEELYRQPRWYKRYSKLRKAPPWIEAGCAILLVVITGAYTVYASKQAKAAIVAANAAKQSADVAHDALIASNRPWIKIDNRIAQPLTFNVPNPRGPVANMLVEATLENVGPSVALNVYVWQDIVLIDSDYSTRKARDRRSQRCDADRHPKGLTGYVMFPKEPPLVHGSHLSQPMEVINKAASESSDGKVGFVVVGCVMYNFAFEPKGSPTHQTRFLYYLAVQQDGGFNAHVLPQGTASQLGLIVIPDGWEID